MDRGKTTRIKVPKIKINLDRQKLLQHKTSRCVSTIMKPLRIFQFFVVLLLFAFTIYMIVMDPMPMSALACILLIVLSGVYVFVLAVELISHFAGGALHVIPMAEFSLLGLLFFGIAGISLIFYAYTQLVVQIIAVVLCLLAALFFLIDITMVLAFWKRRCSVCKRCCNNSTTELLLHRDEEPSALEGTETMKHDVTTSLSDVRLPRELEDVAIPDHCYRKTEYPRRREYVDCPTCVPSLCNLEVAQIQTEPKRVSVVESQTPSAITKETPMQTLSKCEFCHQQIQFPLAPPNAEGAVVSKAHCFQHPSQWSYPAIVQFVREGVSVPCCPGCKCMADTTQTQQQQQPLAQTVKKPNETLTSETTQQVTNSGSRNDDKVTKLTTAQAIPTYTDASPRKYIKPDKSNQTVPDIVYKRKVNAAKTKEDAKPTSEDVDRNFAEEPITMLAKTEGPEIVEETLIEDVDIKKERDEGNTEGSEEEKTIGEDKVERSKGGGEHLTRTYQEFMRATKQGRMINMEESPRHTVAMQTSGMLITPLSSRTKPRALLPLKSNKVDPIKDDVNISDEDRISEKIASRTTFDNQAAQEDKHIGSLNPIIEYQMNDACSLCKRQKSLTPTSDNSRCYTVFKDRKRRYFCEFCAPLDSIKITSRLEDMDLRKLRCANCRSSLRDRSVRTIAKLKSGTCPKCGQSQRHEKHKPSPYST